MLMQRKHYPALILLLIAVSLLVFSPGESVQAAPSTALPIEMASSFPADTAFYFSMNTGPGLIEQLNTMYGNLAPALIPLLDAQDIPLPRNFQSVLNMFSVNTFGADFDTSVRSWLGERIAIGMDADTINEAIDAENILIAVDITNRDEAIAFIENNLGLVFEHSQQGDFTVLTEEFTVAAFSANKLFLAPSADQIPFNGLPESNLSLNGLFMDTVTALPAPDYHALLYLDSAAMFGDLSDMVYQTPGEAELLLPLLEGFGAVAVAATIEDGRSLVLDIAQTPNMDAMLETPLLDLNLGPVEPAFWNHIPANASLVMHSSDLKAVYDTLIDIIRITEDPTIDKQTAQIEEQLQTLLGLSFHNDILSWMTGNYALFFSYAVEPGQPSLIGALINPEMRGGDLGLEFGVVIEATDPAKAQQLVEALAPILTVMTLQQEGISVSEEQIGGANAMVLTANAPDLGLTIDLVMAANDNVFVLGTRNGVTDALNGSGGLTGAPRFAEAQGYMLANPGALFFADQSIITFIGDIDMLGDSVNNIFAGIAASLIDPSYAPPVASPPRPGQRAAIAETMRTIRQVAALFNSATITTTTDNQGNTLMRFVITLAQR